MPHVAHQGDYVQAAGSSLQIISECTPLVPAVLLCGAIAAFPAAARLRALGVAAGLVLLWIYNVLRIVVLVAVLAYKPAIFDLIHVYLWQSVTIVLVAVLFAAWLRMTEANSTAKSAG
jgi:exosortase/archaeosortase family protein